MYYDDRGRVIQTKSNSHLTGGIEKEYIAYNFTGQPTLRKHIHMGTGKATQTEVYTYTYDHAERLLSVTHKLNSSTPVTLAGYTYDEIGRILTKKLAAETSTYNYNVRSWLTQINGTKFNQTLAYNTPVNGITPTTALYNGNISAMKWKAGDESTERGYKFTYDNLSRLTAAAYGEGASLTSNLNRFNEAVTAYDKMGNILALQRQGKLDSGYGMMDDLAYTYTGNQLTKVSDAATPSITYANAFHFVDRANVANEYAYDTNGNLTKDLNKNITSISYNVLNLPSVITFADGNTITYGYDASGSKLSVAYTEGGSTVKTEYAGNKVYKNGTLGMILTEEGYITLSGSTPTYHYYLKDHQGNNRVVINQSGAVQQVNHYYPFGGLFGEGLQASNQPYKYNGKELDRQLDLDLYDYGARHYDTALGRWHSVDPYAEKYNMLSPYNYCINNPIKYVDPDGRDGMVTGSGTKEDPYVVTATYLYENGSLNEDQTKALNGAVDAYNDMGGKNGIKSKDADGNTTYTKYNLSAKGVDNVDEARSETQFENSAGETRYYGNKVGTGANTGGSGDELGSANNIRVDFNQANIDAGVANTGYDKSAVMKGVAIHEIGHNLGGEHSDGTSTMQGVNTTITTSNGTTTTTHSYPSASKSFMKTIFDRRDTQKNHPSDGRLWTKP